MIAAIKSWLAGGKTKPNPKPKPKLTSYVIADLRKNSDTINRKNITLTVENAKLRDRLSRIAALETPRCAHIGKVAARIARGE